MASGIRLTDLELLSAYLDDELSPRERAALEARLAVEPALQAELDELRRAAQILRAAPQLTPPRSFVLDPAIYRRRPPWWLRYGAFRLAGMLGTAAAVMFIAFGLILMSRPSGVGVSQSIAYQATQPVSDLAVQETTSAASASEGGTGPSNTKPSAAPAVALQATATPVVALAQASPALLATATVQAERRTEPPPTASPVGRDKGSVTEIAAAPPVPSTPTAARALGGMATPAAESLGSASGEATMNSRRADETSAANVPAPSGGPADGAGYMLAPTATALAMEQPAQGTSAAKSVGAIPPMVAGTSVPAAAPTLAPSPSATSRPTTTSTGTPVPSATSRPITAPSGTPLPSATPLRTNTASAMLTRTVTPVITPSPSINGITAAQQALDPTARLLLVVGMALLIISLLVFGIAWARSHL